MELLLGLSALIFALAVLALVGFLIPTIMELRRSLQQVERTTAHLNAHLPEIVSNLHDITDNVSEITEMGREQLEGVGETVDHVRQSVERVTHIERRLRRQVTPILQVVGTLSASARAPQAFLTVIRHRDGRRR